MRKAGLTSSEVGVGGDEKGVSVETDWLHVEGACSMAICDASRMDDDIVPFGIGGSALSSSFTGAGTLNRQKK